MATTEKKTDAKTDKPINPEIVALSSKLKKAITIDKETGVATVTPGVYVENLPEGLSEDVVKEVQHYNSHFLHATVLALGEEAIPMFKKHQKLDNVTVDIPTVGRDNIHVGINRSSSAPKPGAPAGSPEVTTYATFKAKVENYSTKPRGELGRIKSHLADLAAAAYGEKK